MKRKLIGQAALRERSRELEVPLERIFACYVKEQLALRLASPEGKERFLLKNPEGLSMNRASGCHRLIYCYRILPGETFTRGEFSKYLKQILKWEQETNIAWSWQSIMQEDHLCVELVAALDQMSIPLELLIYPCEVDPEQADEYMIRLTMENNSRGTVYVYPRQMQLFEDICDALEQLELVGDLSIYDRIYDTLGNVSYDGRQMWKKLEKHCVARGIVLDDLRYQQMKRYQSYPYLKKKWKAYLKIQGRVVPAWEDVYGRFWSFLSPPWEAVKNGMIYLGTWIPDLGRYLD